MKREHQLKACGNLEYTRQSREKTRMNKEIRLFEKNQTRLVCRGYGSDFLFSCIIHLVSHKKLHSVSYKRQFMQPQLKSQTSIQSTFIQHVTISRLLYVKSIEYGSVLSASYLCSESNMMG